MFILENVTCGNLGEIDSMIPAFTSLIITIIKIAIPVILIFLGMLDLGKAVTSSDEKEMKEAQGKFIKRLIYAVLVFFVVAIVQLLFSTLGRANSDEGNTATSCISCFINDECE